MFRSLLATMGLIWGSTAEAASYDPELTWRTITTEHFRILFHQGEEQLADEYSIMVEDVYATMTEEIQWRPKGKIEVILVDRTDIANGYASTVPRNAIVIYVTAPQEDSALDLYEDWNEAIFTHELTHILHLDTVHGTGKLGRAVVGRIASVNSISPSWIVEGFATFQETRHSAGGRGRNPLADMIKRTAVLENTFPPLGNMDGYQPDPPAGSLRYLFGQDFIQYIADTHGEDTWTRWVHAYGGGIPYYLPSKHVFGEWFPAMYKDWKADRTLKYEAQKQEVEAEGIREGRILSDPKASCTAPSFSPDGEKLVWNCYDMRTGAAIWMSNGVGEQIAVHQKRAGAKNFTWRSDSQAFVYAATHVVNRFNTWSDIYLRGLDGSTSTLTNGKRARDPDFSPDGTRLLVVTNEAQNTQLAMMTVDRRLETSTQNTTHIQYSTPRFAPDGQTFAVSVMEKGRRDLWLYDLKGTPLRRLTADSASDRDPEWSADGKWLFFTSDRSGIPNIYAIEVATEHLFQVTNVTTGASTPSVSPDGRWLAYQQYSSDGWEIRLLDRTASTPIDRGFLPRPLDSGAPLSTWVGAPVVAQNAEAWVGEPVHARPGGIHVDAFALSQQPGESTDLFEQSDAKGVFGKERDYPFRITPKRYNPLRTLPPTYWLPGFQLTPYEAKTLKVIPRGNGAYQSFQFEAYTGGRDTLAYIAYDAKITYRTDADHVGWGANLVVNRWLPVFSAGASNSAVPFGEIGLETDEVDENGDPVLTASGQRYWENRTQGYLSVSYPYTYRTSVFARYSLTYRQALNEIPSGAAKETIPTQGYIGSLAGGWRYSWGRGTAYAVSPEDARIFSLVGGVLHPYLGTWVENDDGELEGLTQVQLTSELREYVVNPWVPNHVLAFRLAGGVTFGAAEFQGNYLLGGNYGDAAAYATPDEFRMVRGYPLGADSGDMYWLTGVEYRAPLWRIERGWGTFPVYLRTLSGAVFVDAGNAFTTIDTWKDAFDGSLVGVGAEIRLSAVALWGLPITARAGYSVGLTPGGYGPTDTRTLYLLTGTSF